MLSTTFVTLSLSLVPALVLGAPAPAPASDRIANTDSAGNVLIVYNPQVTNPTENAKWCIGSSVNVTWDASDIPEDAKENRGRILLGYEDGQEGGEHLDAEHPLAKGFLLTDEYATVTVPDVEPREDYIVAVMGDSGNISKHFSISHCNSVPGEGEGEGEGAGDDSASESGEESDSDGEESDSDSDSDGESSSDEEGSGGIGINIGIKTGSILRRRRAARLARRHLRL